MVKQSNIGGVEVFTLLPNVWVKGKPCCYVLLPTGSLSSTALSFNGELVFTPSTDVWVMFGRRATLCCQGVTVWHWLSLPCIMSFMPGLLNSVQE